jgi:aminoglycoside 2''-phosphotransferase
MDLHLLATHLCEAFPDAAIATPLAVLGEGFGSVAITTANDIVFRIAKHHESQRAQQRERAVLPVIHRHVALRVPEVIYFLQTSAHCPFGVIGYKKIPGRPLAPNDLSPDNRAHIAEQVAAFQVELRAIDLDLLRNAGLPRFPPSPERLSDLWQNVVAYLAPHLSHAEYQAIRRWHEALLTYGQRYPYKPTLVHGDCWYENLLFDEEWQRLIGVIDFENVSVGDAAIDLATQHYLGDQFAQEVIDAYYSGHIPHDLPARMRDLMALRELMGLEQGILLGNVDEDAVEKVRSAIR